MLPSHLRGCPVQQLALLREVGAPDVAPIDHARREHASLGPGRQQLVELLGSTHQIDMQALHGQRDRRG